jgi:hypothetical protein
MTHAATGRSNREANGLVSVIVLTFNRSLQAPNAGEAVRWAKSRGCTSFVAVHEKIVRPLHYSALPLAGRARQRGLPFHASRRTP